MSPSWVRRTSNDDKQTCIGYCTKYHIQYKPSNRWSDAVKPWNVQSKSKPQALARVTGSLLYMHDMSQRCSHSPATVSQSHICDLHSLDRCSWWQRSLPFCFDEPKSIALSFHSCYKASTSLSLYYCIHTRWHDASITEDLKIATGDIQCFRWPVIFRVRAHMSVWRLIKVTKYGAGFVCIIAHSSHQDKTSVF